jgi:orotate phosphoribosyltransferase
MNEKEIRQRIEDTCLIRGDFVLRSGQKTDYYFDKYLLESDPELLGAISEVMLTRLPKMDNGQFKFGYFAGLETGGIPIATVLSQITRLPTLFVRKKRKGYGTCKIAEGPNFDGNWLCVVEDVITTGGQVIDSCQRLINDGAKIDTVVCAILRDEKGRENIENAGFDLHTAFDFTQG